MDKEIRGDGRSVDREADRDAMQQKIDAYSAMLYKIAYLQLRNSQDAEDVVQETFYQFIKSGKEFDTKEYEKAWFIKVTLNGCRKIWRSAWYRHTDILPEYETAEDAQTGGMEAEALQRERNRELMEVVLKLPRKYREVIHLFYYQQMSVKEICLVTGRKESTVTSQLTRGRELLKKNLREEYQYE